jgi:hypothetical protein
MEWKGTKGHERLSWVDGRKFLAELNKSFGELQPPADVPSSFEFNPSTPVETFLEL